jgi:hypothetical protein
VQEVWIAVRLSGRKFSYSLLDKLAVSGRKFLYSLLDKLAVTFTVLSSELTFRRRQHLVGREAQIKGYAAFKHQVKSEASSRETHHKKEVYDIGR